MYMILYVYIYMYIHPIDDILITADVGYSYPVASPKFITRTNFPF